MQMVEKDGERGRNRTFNLLIKSQLLCQLSYAPALHCEGGQTLIIPSTLHAFFAVGPRAKKFSFCAVGSRNALGLNA